MFVATSWCEKPSEISPNHCEAWVSYREDQPPPGDVPEGLAWYCLASPLFQQLDVLGTKSPLLVIRVVLLDQWEPAEGFLPGCNLLVPFQDPENVGAVIRSAAAFGVAQVILLSESAHPYHPKALRASGGAVLRIRLRQGPSLKDLQQDLPMVALSPAGARPGWGGVPPGLWPAARHRRFRIAGELAPGRSGDPVASRGGIAQRRHCYGLGPICVVATKAALRGSAIDSGTIKHLVP